MTNPSATVVTTTSVTDTRQAPATRAAFESAGLADVRVLADDHLAATVVTGRRR
jgi:hypothetical protein